MQHHSCREECRARRPLQSQAGFSLLETVVAMALLGTALISLARSVAMAAVVLRKASLEAEATDLATGVLEILEALPAGHPWVEVGGGLQAPAAGKGGAWFLDFPRGQVRWQVSRAAPPSPFLRLDVAVVAKPARGGGPLVHLQGLRRAE
ncbi:MAG: prepilin-type N-terminal cleavage/methylation domain-containing protein [Acidobacteriota bacterium]